MCFDTCLCTCMSVHVYLCISVFVYIFVASVSMTSMHLKQETALGNKLTWDWRSVFNIYIYLCICICSCALVFAIVFAFVFVFALNRTERALGNRVTRSSSETSCDSEMWRVQQEWRSGHLNQSSESVAWHLGTPTCSSHKSQRAR